MTAQRRLSADQLQFVTKAKKSYLDSAKFGEHLTNRSGYTISEVIAKACSDRLTLAKSCMSDANAAYSNSLYRLTISRSYYAMYHAMRAVVFYDYGGDDHEAHSRLHEHLPGDLEDREMIGADLKAARLRRNEADYDPYPRDEKNFQTDAEFYSVKAKGFLLSARKYLREKGCRLT